MTESKTLYEYTVRCPLCGRVDRYQSKARPAQGEFEQRCWTCAAGDRPEPKPDTGWGR